MDQNNDKYLVKKNSKTQHIWPIVKFPIHLIMLIHYYSFFSSSKF